MLSRLPTPTVSQPRTAGGTLIGRGVHQEVQKNLESHAPTWWKQRPAWSFRPTRGGGPLPPTGLDSACGSRPRTSPYVGEPCTSLRGALLCDLCHQPRSRPLETPNHHEASTPHLPCLQIKACCQPCSLFSTHRPSTPRSTEARPSRSTVSWTVATEVGDYSILSTGRAIARKRGHGLRPGSSWTRTLFGTTTERTLFRVEDAKRRLLVGGGYC